MDHVSEVISRAFHDSEIAKRFSCRRTKSAAIAYNVLGNNFEEKMLAELRPRPENETERSPVFSLIIDESTDVSTTKSIDPSSRMHFLPIQNMYLGTNVAMTLESLKDDIRMRSKIEEFLNRCQSFLIELSNQFLQRLPCTR
ncbi:unnamed protein product [Parnassius apollo]|uniref:(apollo) hypothetical protein n=1 Tax=Parnassius apollo TaxID=110799 RepID=A0A8S3X9I5_PARAO|nr:unnamed protein product [Parnassius apollo]